MHLLTENDSRIPYFQERRKKNASLRHETIADAADGDDMLGRAGVVLDLAAQAVDIDHDGVVVHSDEIAPDLLVYHILGEHLLRVAHKEQQQAALFLGEVQLHIAFIKAHGGGVAEERPAADLLVVLLREALAAADEGLDLCAQNLGAKGLGDIVVGAQREAVHEVVVLVAAADDDDRRGDAVAPDGLDDIEALHVAQRDVHQDHIQRAALPRDEVQRRRAAVDDEGVHLIAYHNFR